MRLGECKRCGFCCRYRFSVAEFTTRSEALIDANDENAKWERRVHGAKHIVTRNNEVLMLTPLPCKYLRMKRGKATCLIHGRSPKTCRVYPSTPNQEFYRVITRDLKVPCGYSFTEDSR